MISTGECAFIGNLNAETSLLYKNMQNVWTTHCNMYGDETNSYLEFLLYYI